MQSLPYEEPKAALIESGENIFSVWFSGKNPHICTVIDSSGSEAGIFLVAREGDKIDLDFFPPGEYKVIVRQGLEIVCVAEIRLK